MKRISIIISIIIASCFFSLPTNASDHKLMHNASSSHAISNDSDDLFDDLDDEDIEVYDPIEPFNRAMFWTNDKLYFYFVKPIAKGYRFIVPERGRISISNFFSNIATPIRIINSALQFKFKDAGTEIGRLAINSTIGILGFFDPAKNHMNIKMKDEDFGQTLGHYGSGSGFYLVVPFFGPSNARDGVGLIVDGFLDPALYIMEKRTDYVGLKLFEAINKLSLDKDTYEGIVRDEIDPYLFIRDAYAQYRAGKIRK